MGDSAHRLDDLLSHLLSPLLEIAPSSIIPMNAQGHMLRDASVRQLIARVLDGPDAGAVASGSGERLREQPLADRDDEDGEDGAVRVYVFDRELLDADWEGAGEALAVGEDQVLAEPPLARKPPHRHRLRSALTHTTTTQLTIAPLSPPTPRHPSILRHPAEDPISAHVALSLHNLTTLQALIHSIALQRASLRVALANLLLSLIHI